MTLARTVSDEAFSREILKTVAGLLKNPASERQEVKKSVAICATELPGPQCVKETFAAGI
jgi:hypothetical protein